MEGQPKRQAETRARDVRWFDQRICEPGKHSDGTPIRRAYGKPWLYLSGLVALPLAYAVAVIHPFNWPRGLDGVLIFYAAVPGWVMVQSWAEDQRFRAMSRRGAFAQAWLYFGGAFPQAIRALMHRQR